MDYSLPVSSVHEISQARILQWIAIPFPWGSSSTRDRIAICIADLLFVPPGKPQSSERVSDWLNWILNPVVLSSLQMPHFPRGGSARILQQKDFHVGGHADNLLCVRIAETRVAVHVWRQRQTFLGGHLIWIVFQAAAGDAGPIHALLPDSSWHSGTQALPLPPIVVNGYQSHPHWHHAGDYIDCASHKYSQKIDR